MLIHERLLHVLAYDGATGIFRWRIDRRCVLAGSIAGTKHARGYWSIGVDGRVYLAHRLAWFYLHGEWPTLDIDHINGDRCDNRIANLRDVSRSQNMENQRGARSNNSTGFLGVLRNRNKFSAHIRSAGNTYCLGTFDTPQEAHAVYMEAKSRLHIQSVAVDRGVVLEPEAA